MRAALIAWRTRGLTSRQLEAFLAGTLPPEGAKPAPKDELTALRFLQRVFHKRATKYAKTITALVGVKLSGLLPEEMVQLLKALTDDLALVPSCTDAGNGIDSDAQTGINAARASRSA